MAARTPPRDQVADAPRFASIAPTRGTAYRIGQCRQAEDARPALARGLLGQPIEDGHALGQSIPTAREKVKDASAQRESLGAQLPGIDGHRGEIGPADPGAAHAPEQDGLRIRGTGLGDDIAIIALCVASLRTAAESWLDREVTVRPDGDVVEGVVIDRR